MTDRVKGFYVTLEKDIRVDDVEFIINAVKAIRYVADVSINISNPDDHMNRMQIKQEIKDKIWDLYKNL